MTETAGLLTLFDDVNKFVSVEAELVCVLGVVGVESFALGHLRFGFRCRFGSPSSRRRPAGCWPVGSEVRRRRRKGETTRLSTSATRRCGGRSSVHWDTAVGCEVKSEEAKCFLCVHHHHLVMQTHFDSN